MNKLLGYTPARSSHKSHLTPNSKGGLSDHSILYNKPVAFGDKKGLPSIKSSDAIHKMKGTLGNNVNHQESYSGLNQQMQTRRVWIKKRNGIPTTIIINRYDIVDDLKLAVINKFPNSLARTHDPAELLIKMDLQTRLMSNINGSNSVYYKKSGNNIPQNSASPDNFKFPSSPNGAFGLVNLEPDQNVWSVLELYYPNGMSMQEALIIDTPGEQLTNSTNTQESFATAMSQNTSNTQTNSSVDLSNHTCYQPKPQYPSKIANNNYPNKEESLSPLYNAKSSPIPSVQGHRRAQSNPPHLDINTSTNNQAVLLLPKNFSLATGGSSSNFQNMKKRLSLDDALVRNGPNMGIGISPSEATSFPGNNSKEFSMINKARTLDEAIALNNNSSSTIAQSDLSISPSPSIDLTSPTKHINGEGKAIEQMSEREKEEHKIILKNPLPKHNADSAEGVLPSISVLVVEDNAINQAILGAFLRKHKIHYQIAKNGQEAVDKWRTGGFHLVLMDIQLPVKSGIEATKEIRHLEKRNKIGVFVQHENITHQFESPKELKDDEKLDLSIFRSPVIIVALTASSNSSIDKKNALTAGCNDYLTKPVNLVWLQNKIIEWGCMQALIDFDGWKSRGVPRTTISGVEKKDSSKSSSSFTSKVKNTS